MSRPVVSAPGDLIAAVPLGLRGRRLVASWAWLLALAASSFPAFAQAASRMAVIAVGDCKSATLLEAAQKLSGGLKSRMGAQVMEPEELGRTHRAPPERSAPELAKALDRARGLLYEQKAAQSVAAVDDVLQDVSRLRPGAERWSLFVRAQLLRGVGFHQSKQPQRAHDAFLRVLALAPDYQLDPNAVPPSARGVFEKVRKGLSQETKAALAVGSIPLGAEVFLDGLRMGVSPVKLQLPRLPYRLDVSDGERLALPRTIDLGGGPGDGWNADLELESGVVSGGPPCVAALSDDTFDGQSPLVSRSAALGRALGLETVALVQLPEARSGTTYLTSRLVDAGGKGLLRQGGLPMKGAAALDGELVDRLAGFTATGATGRGLLVDAALTTALQAPAPRVVDIPLAAAPSRQKAEADAGLKREGQGTSLRELAWLPAAVGGACLAGGAISYGIAQTQRERIESGRGINSVAELNAVTTAGKRAQTWAVVLGSAGAAGLLTAGGFYLWGGTGTRMSVTAWPSEDGATLSWSVWLP